MTRGYSDFYEKEYIRKDGTVFPSTEDLSHQDEQGNAEGMWATVRDYYRSQGAKTAPQRIRRTDIAISIRNQAGESKCMSHCLNSTPDAVASTKP